MTTSYELGEMVGRDIIKPILLLVLGGYFGYRYVKRRQKENKINNKNEGGDK